MSISSTETGETLNNALIVEMKRTAIDSFGRLGSLYDGRRDCLVGQLSVNNQENYQSNKIVQGEIKYGNNDQLENILRRLPINEQLRLSILLKLAPSGNIASFIDYHNLTNEYTRFFCYSNVDRVQQLPDRIEDAQQFINSSMPSTIATHIITGIEWGTDLVVVLQLPSDANTVKEIDGILEKLLTFLLHDNIAYTITPDEESLLKKIVYTKVYANVPYLNSLTTVYDLCHCVKEKTISIIDYPISYTLRSIKCLYPRYDGESVTFTPLSVELNDKIEEYVLQLTADIKTLKVSVTKDTPRLLGENLKQRLSDVQEQWLDVKNKFINEIKRLSNIVIEIRSGQDEKLVIQQIDNSIEQVIMKNSINSLIQSLKDLEEREQFEDLNVVKHVTDHADIEIIIEHRSTEDGQRDQTLCLNDCLNKNNSEQFQTLHSDFEEGPKHNSIGADYSNGILASSETMVLPSEKRTHEDVNDHIPCVSSTTAEISSPPPTEPQISGSPASSQLVSTDETINILLLGETGVGKSTFINAFANYLTFNTLQQAETGQPVVLIPVSFLITLGDNFDEHIVTFGDIDDSNNEDFKHPGQSVTQYCKSYVFNLDRTDGKKLRIIDTPGFGDTRGIDQDDRNMEHILEYFKNLSHLNAICFLLKPNEARLNIFYRSCLIQLFSLLKSNPSDNIIFCFTNARSTFYTPGDTAPLLRKMLTSLPKNDVSFKKDNTFCFDSESFRYLVALQKQIQFNDVEKEEYEMSWIKSVKESNRLVHYICEVLTAHRMQDE